MRLLLCLLCSCVPAFATDYYVTQAGAGDNSGSSPSNAKSLAQINAFTLSPGDRIRIVGTISTLGENQSGTLGNPITVLWESGAKISLPAGLGIYAANRSYLVFDGGSNGIIENTANGSALSNQLATTGIALSGSDHVTVKNLTIQNLYVHSSVSDTVIDIGTCAGVYMNGYGAGMAIQDCTFSNMGWCVTGFGNPSGLLTVTRCSFDHYDHGIGGVASPSGTVAGFVATYNHFGTTANWDTTANAYHHDGIHTFWGNGSGGIPNAVITNNLCDGDWGINNTAHFFFEQNYNTHNPAEAPGWLIANNVFIQNAGNYLNNGMLVSIGDTATIANNTFFGSSVALTRAALAAGTGIVFKNNLVYGVNLQIQAGTFAASGLNNNIYANIVGGGNDPFFSGSYYSTLAAWKTATGQDGNSSQVSGMTLNSNGSLTAGNAAIGAGLDLSSVFTVDYTGATRTVPWDVGAYKSASPGTVPVITLDPVSLVVTAGGSATFTATASGVPTPTWQWKLHGTPIAGATNSTYSIPSTVSADAGSYTATATNLNGSATSAAAILTVNIPPSVPGNIPATPVIIGITP